MKFLTIEGGKLVLRAGSSVTVITTPEELAAATESGVMASSSIDFPEESTSDPTVLALVALLNR